MISRIFLLAVFLLAYCPAFAADANPALDQGGIAVAIGKEGTFAGGIYKVSMPRYDLKVTAGKIAVKPEFALTNWAAFKKSGDSAVTYGDLVLLESELNPVLGMLEEKGIGISAVHNHLIYEIPRMVYIHFIGYGNEVALAKGLRAAVALTATPLKSVASRPETKTGTVREIEKALGYEGGFSGGILHVNVVRGDLDVRMAGIEMPGGMGMNTSLNFQMDGETAAINGDFLLLAGEVDPVIKVLRDNGIEIASLHNHMLTEEPRVFFMHFWAHGNAVSLAKGLRAALDKTGIKR